MQNTLNHLLNVETRSDRHKLRSQFLNDRIKYAFNLYSKDLKAHYSCVNASCFSNQDSNHFISGGDDKRILLWNVNKDIFSTNHSPLVMKTQHNSNIFTLAWDNENKRIFSGANDHQVIVHDVEKQVACDVFLHENAVLSISVHPRQSEIFATACESGQVSLYDLRISNSDPIILASSRSLSSTSSSSTSLFNSFLNGTYGGSYQACCFNPVQPNLLAVGNELSGLSLLDTRMNSTLLRYKVVSSSISSSSTENTRNNSSIYNQNVMCVKFNNSGTQLAAIRFKYRPVIYSLNEQSPVHLFDHTDYSNCCTLKGCCFAGEDDQYFVTGSDDFSVYVWKIPTEKSASKDSENEDTEKTSLTCDSHLILKGHRSIVNQCCYNYKYNLIASNGVEKLIKIWSPYQLPGETNGGLKGKAEEYAPKRKLYTNKDFFELRWNHRNGNSHDFSDSNDSTNRLSDEGQSFEEDKIMIAFFDSQVRKYRRSLLLSERFKHDEDDSDNSDDSDDDEVDDFDDDDDEDDEDEDDMEDDLGFDRDYDDVDDYEGDDMENIIFDDLTENESSDIRLQLDDSDTSTNTSFSETDDKAKTSRSNEQILKDLVKDENEKKLHSPLMSSSDLTSESDNDLLSQVENKKKSKKVPLRDRVRNLRHRQSMNLTQQTDYIEVLDGLNVKHECNDETDDYEILKSNIKISDLDTCIEIAKPSSDYSDQEKNQSKSNSLLNLNLSKSSSTNNLVKSLKEQKRKIELDEDSDSEIFNSNDEDDESRTVLFKKNSKTLHLSSLPTTSKEIASDDNSAASSSSSSSESRSNNKYRKINK